VPNLSRPGSKYASTHRNAARCVVVGVHVCACDRGDIQNNFIHLAPAKALLRAANGSFGTVDTTIGNQPVCTFVHGWTHPAVIV
jgi:hypothetical protein